MTAVEKFLVKHNQASIQVDVDSSLAKFVAEMRRGLDGNNSKIPMIPTYLDEVNGFTPNSKRILIDAGGTNLRTAIGYFTKDGQAVIERAETVPMLGSCGRVSKEEFYGGIAKSVARLLQVGGDVGFCFSYNVKMNSQIDGLVEYLAKEIDAPEVWGTMVGAETLAAIAKYSDKKRNIVVLNDTVATLLGGKALNLGKKYGGYIGYIYGTGTNLCYLEKTKNITKISDAQTENMIINTEAGGFAGFAMGDYDKAVIGATADPDAQQFEKIVSGKYLAQIITMCLNGFSQEGGFSDAIRFENIDLKEVSEFLCGGENRLFDVLPNTADRTLAKELCREVIDRAAKMGAIANAAAVITVGTPFGLPVAIVAEGTTFFKLTGYRANFEKYLDDILKQRRYSYERLTG
ncbi:MAG: hypothetical protein NC350_06610, partial [Corallococcus sp.]|nr:hypothetical protein [Corallococcus sp.]